MSIIFSAVARGTQVLAQNAFYTGNFTEVTAHILAKMQPHDEKISFSSGNYLFHFITENKLVYFCITTDKFAQSKAFSFLNEIKKRYQTSTENTQSTSAAIQANYSTDGEFVLVLKNEMARYNNNQTSLPKVKAELEELKSIMAQNVDKAALRGERIETLMNRTDGLAENTHTYRSISVRVRRKYWWQNIKMYIILAVVSVLVVYFIGAMACGGLAWRNCVG